MDRFTIFYSWQSDDRVTKNEIQNGIGKAIKQSQKEINLELRLDSDTRHTPGSPSIIETILRKIDVADIFICDVTLVLNSDKKSSPNPNVLIELGYAIKTLGQDRIICICNTDYGTIEKLPFDIRSNRILIYGTSNKEHLSGSIQNAIKQIIENYDEILSKFNNSNFSIHEKLIFDKIDAMYPEHHLINDLDWVTSTQAVRSEQLAQWDKLIDFHEYTSNHFIHAGLKALFYVYIEQLLQFENYCVKIKGDDRMQDDGSWIYFFSKKWPGEQWEDFDRRSNLEYNNLCNLASKVKKAYKDFRMKVKQELCEILFFFLLPHQQLTHIHLQNCRNLVQYLQRRLHVIRTPA